MFFPLLCLCCQDFSFWPLVLLQGGGITLASLLRDLGVSSPATLSETCPLFSVVGISKAAAAHV